MSDDWDRIHLAYGEAMHAAQQFELQLRALGGVYGGSEDSAANAWIETFFNRPLRKVANRLRVDVTLAARLAKAVNIRNDLAHSYLLVAELRMSAPEAVETVLSDLERWRHELQVLADELEARYPDRAKHRPRDSAKDRRDAE